jgi:hypothetical protein
LEQIGTEQKDRLAVEEFRNRSEEVENQRLMPYQYFITQFKNTRGGRLLCGVAEESEEARVMNW